LPCEITIHKKDGGILRKSTMDYEGFFTRPMSWETASEKFRSLAGAKIDTSLQKEIIELVSQLDKIKLRELTAALGKVPGGVIQEWD
jgi:2-methylcitrate dehydratase